MQVYDALKNFKDFIQEMGDEDFEFFMSGKPIFGAMLPPRFYLEEMNFQEMHKHIIKKLEFRIS